MVLNCDTLKYYMNMIEIIKYHGKVTRTRMLCKGNGVLYNSQIGVVVMRCVEELPLRIEGFIKITILLHLEFLMWKWKFESKFFKKILHNSLMGCSPFANYRFKMGITVIGFAEHFGQEIECWFHLQNTQLKNNASIWIFFQIPYPGQ